MAKKIYHYYPALPIVLCSGSRMSHIFDASLACR